MAGIFDNIANFFTGERENKAQAEANNRANELAEAANRQREQAFQATGAAENDLGNQATFANQLAQHFGLGAQQSFGSNAADTMRLANNAAEGQADQAANAGSMAAARQAIAAARGAGLNKGQASLRAAQNTGDTYSNLYQGGLESGRNQYNQAASNFANIGAQQQGLEMNARIAQGNLGLGQGNQAIQGTSDAAGESQGAAKQAATNSAIGGELLNGLTQGIASVAGKAPKGGAVPAGSTPPPAALAKGGKLEPDRVNIVGESGPEAIVGDQVIPNNPGITLIADKLANKHTNLFKILDQIQGNPVKPTPPNPPLDKNDTIAPLPSGQKLENQRTHTSIFGNSKGGKLRNDGINIVGEKGPEAVIGDQVIPNNPAIDKMAEKLSGTDNTDAHIADLSRQVFELKQKLKMAGVK